MTFDEARGHIVAAIQEASGMLHDPRFVRVLADPHQDVSFETLEFDSLAALEFCMSLEDRTGIELDLADMVGHPSINALAGALTARRAEPGREVRRAGDPVP